MILEMLEKRHARREINIKHDFIDLANDNHEPRH